MVKSNAKKWLFIFISLILVFVMFFSFIVYTIDPFFQFRVRDNSYMLNERFVGSGLIKNYDYNTLIVGSSMTQNFNMDTFREELGVKPLHIGIGGIRCTEEKELLNLAYNTGKANKYYLCAEMYLFTADSSESRIPKYLIEDSFFARCRYFLNYEAWFRYMPVDIGLIMLDKFGIQQPKKFQYLKSIDHLGDWSLDFVFGEEEVLSNYKSGSYGVSNIEMDNLYAKMTARIDDYFDFLQFDKGEHVFFFAPYSMLYWADQNDEMTDVLLEGKRYFIKKATEKGAVVYDFQIAEFTSDLNNYKDLTHYKPEINEWMVEQFKTQEYNVTLDNYDIFKDKILTLKEQFRAEHANLF